MDNPTIDKKLENTSDNKETFVDVHGITRYKTNGQIAPGSSGNLKGKPKGSISIIAILKRKLEEVPEGNQKAYAELLVDRIFKKAIQEGDNDQIKNILHYVDGPPKQTIHAEIDNISDFDDQSVRSRSLADDITAFKAIIARAKDGNTESDKRIPENKGKLDQENGQGESGDIHV